MAPGRLRRGHRAGYRHQRPAQLGRVSRGVQRAAALPSLHDHGAAGQRGDGPVAGKEPQPGGMPTRRPLADHQTLRGDVREQARVARRVRIIDAAGQDRDGDGPASQRAAVSGGVDAVGPLIDNEIPNRVPC